MSRFANLADKPKVTVSAPRPPSVDNATSKLPEAHSSPMSGTPPSRVGRKAIAAYFSPEMSLAMHFCARKHGLSLQELMAEAFDDVLRKYGESPIGE
jgi:hypothetical protein